MPLESRFSVQVTQPYLNEPFPVRPVDPNQDRVFKHITFLEEKSDLTLRLRAINRSYITETSILQKHVPTNVYVNDIHQETFRVKTVMSQPDYGIDESYWVTNKNMDSSLAASHNQYRIRGISKENWRGDWVYSELRDFDNDLIVYNMLYDILDLLSTVQDGQIDYVMDYIVNDTFIKVIQEKMPKFATVLDWEEVKAAGLVEVLSLLSKQATTQPKEDILTQLGENFLALSTEMKKEFKENVMSSPKEFSELYRVYKLFDQFQEKKQDLLGLLIEVFLEERFEKLVQKTDIEVLLQNDEEIGIYLNGTYEFDIKSELISSIYDASPDDHFVTCINDAVQLLSEPVIFEQLVYQQNEEVEKYLRMVLQEVYVPLAAVDVRLLELESELEDRHETKIHGGVVEYTTFDEDFESRYMLLFDVAETLIKGDLSLEQDYEGIILDHALKTMIDSRKTLLIDYNFGEFVEILLRMGESFQHQYTQSFNRVDESQNIQIVDQFSSNNTVSKTSLHDAYQTAFLDFSNLAQVKSPKSIKEEQSVGLLERMIQAYSIFKESVDEVIVTIIQEQATRQSIVGATTFQEALPTGQLENALLADIYSYFLTKEDADVRLLETIGSKDITASSVWQESKPMLPEEMYYNLFKHHLRDPNKYPVLEELDAALGHDLQDMYFMEGEDLVQYALGDMDDGWPLGVFRLGINTLKGEVSDS